MASVCFICNSEVQPEKEISCDFCKRYLHSTCAGISRQEASVIRSKDRRLSYNCSSCMDIKVQCSKLHDISNIVRALQNDLQSLKDDVQSLKNKVLDKAAVPVDDHFMEQVIEEINDRKERECNIIIYNLSEPSSSARTERLSDERALVSTTLQNLNGDCNIEIVKTLRLGSFRPGVCRPVKVTLSNKEVVLRVLRSKNKKSLAPVSISADLTVKQREYLKKLRTELREINEQGHNKTIRYINGVPRIVDSKNHLRHPDLTTA